MENDYVKMLMESNVPIEERLRIAGQLLNTYAEMNENNEARISNYEKMIDNYGMMVKILKKKAGIGNGEHEKPPSNKYTVKEHQTLCWTCKNAVPDKIGEQGCSWSRRLKPVEGWIAVETKNSYKVIECPEYIPDGDDK